MTNRAASHRKSGPGRRHVEGRPSSMLDGHLFGQKLARKAARLRLTKRHP